MITQLTEKEICIISGGIKSYLGNLADWSTYFWSMEGAKGLSKKIKETWDLGEKTEILISFALFITTKTAGYAAGMAATYILAKIANHRHPHAN